MPTWSVDDGSWNQMNEPDLPELHCYLRTGGWTVEEVDGGYAYVAPGGKGFSEGGQCGTDYYWEPDEAIQVMEGR